MLDIFIRRHDDDCLERLQKKGVIQDRFHLTKPEKKLLLHIRDNNCRCPMWARGTNEYGKSYLPFALKCRSWKAAEEAIKEYNQPPAKSTGENLTVAIAVERWVTSVRNNEKAEATIDQYQYIGNLLVAFCEKQKKPEIETVAQIETHHMELLMAEWRSKARTTRRNRQGWLATFFTYCFRMGWITSIPTDKLEKIRQGRADREEEREEATLPLDEDGSGKNFQKIRAAIRPYLAGEIGQREHRTANPGRYKTRQKTSPIGSRPDHLIAIADLMIETGLRVCDTVFFEVDKMEVGPRYATYECIQIKTGHPVEVSIPLELAKRLQKLERISPRYLFLDQTYDKATDKKKWHQYITNNVYAYLRAAGAAVGVEGVRPHRFRDSFALNRLLEGLDMHELQTLLGHRSLKTTERYYAPLVKGRKSRIAERAMAARLGEKTSTKVIPIVAAGRRAS